MYEYELLNACVKLLRDMFQMKPGETIAITYDTNRAKKSWKQRRRLRLY